MFVIREAIELLDSYNTELQANEKALMAKQIQDGKSTDAPISAKKLAETGKHTAYDSLMDYFYKMDDNDLDTFRNALHMGYVLDMLRPGSEAFFFMPDMDKPEQWREYFETLENRKEIMWELEEICPMTAIPALRTYEMYHYVQEKQDIRDLKSLKELAIQRGNEYTITSSELCTRVGLFYGDMTPADLLIMAEGKTLHAAIRELKCRCNGNCDTEYVKVSDWRRVWENRK